LQLLQIIDEWTRALDSNRCVDVAYIDFARAFDSVSHPKLISKLERYGFSDQLLSWLKAFLSNRSFQVKVGNSLSDSFNSPSGVPQGSILGPTLFLLYACDIPQLPHIVMFADDLKVFDIFPPHRSSHLDDSLAQISHWSHSHQLPIANSKCSVMYLGKNNPCLAAHLDNSGLSVVSSSVRDLGVLFTPNLSCTPHCTMLYRKAFSQAFCILKAFKCNDVDILLKAYKTYVRPILESSSSVWNPHLVSDINRIEKVQKYFTRILFNRCFFFFPGVDPSYPSRLSLFGLEFLEIRRAKIDLLLYFKITHNLTCLDPSLLAPPSSLSSMYGYFIPKISPRSTKSRRNSFFARVSSIYRKLPRDVLALKSPESFSSALDKLDYKYLGDLHCVRKYNL
jgi:hypothetical protein